MLKYYKDITPNKLNQFVIINENGTIVETEIAPLKEAIGQSMSSIHPFFETLNSLIKIKDQEFNFKCVNLKFQNKKYITDITIKTFEKDPNSIIIIDDLTSHYDNLHAAIQLRNESIINAELLKIKNQLLEKKESFKMQFIRTFSHEINIPTKSIDKFSSLLKNTNLTESQQHNLNVIENTNNQLKYIINDILDISKIETDVLQTKITRFDLFDTLNYINTLYDKKCNGKGLCFSYNLNPSIPQFIEGDQYRLKQILTNLIENALKYTTKGEIEFNVVLKNKIEDTIGLDFEIRDTGLGISEDNLNLIYNPFYQVKPEKQGLKLKGAGLGLSIVKQLLTVLNGKITVKSQINKGSVFTVSLNYLVSKNQKENRDTEPQEAIT